MHLIAVLRNNVQAIGRPHCDEKHRHDHGQDGEWNTCNGHESKVPDQCKRHTKQRKNDIKKFAIQAQQHNTNQNERDGRQPEKIFLRQLRQCLGNKRHPYLIKTEGFGR